MLQRFSYASEHMVDIKCDNYNGNSNDSQIITNFLALESLCKFLCQKKEIHIEVNTEKNHKNGDNNLYVGAVACNTVVFYTEASCSGSFRMRYRECQKAAFFRTAGE